MDYQIKSDLIPGLPRLPYRNGLSAYEGVVNHSTATPEASAANERIYEGSHWQDAFVHFFVDWNDIIQVADTAYLAWGAGPAANQRYVHIELCETADTAKFQVSYARYVWITAKILRDKNMGVTDGRTLVSHAWVSANLGGTDHQDPVDYLASHGVSWAQHVANVKAAYDAPFKQLSAAASTFQIKVLASQLWYYNKPDWYAKQGIVTAGQVFTVVDTLTVNGSKMYKLKSGTYITANPQYVKVL